MIMNEIEDNKNESRLILNNLKFSSPSRANGFHIKKLYKNDNGCTVFQQYSYQEITDNNRFKKLHKFTETTLNGTELTKSKSELMLFSKSLQINKPERNLDKYMPDIHFEDRMNKEEPIQRNKIPRLLIQPKNDTMNTKRSKKYLKNKSFIYQLVKILTLGFIPIILGILYILYFTNSGFVSKLDTTNITRELRNSLYGQDEIIDKLEYNLNLIRNDKVFLFFGGVGVGKTYTSQIIERNFPSKNVQKFIFCSESKFENIKNKIFENLKSDEHNLIIIDDFSSENVYSLLPIISNLSSTDTRFILIIIFNNLNDDSMDFATYHDIKFKANDISNIFLSNNIDHATYVFKNIGVDNVKKCIKNGLVKRGKYRNDDDVDKVLENINYQHSGCKGVHAKIALINHDM